MCTISGQSLFYYLQNWIFLLTDANVVYYMICKKCIFIKLSFQPLFLSIVVKYNSFLKYFSRRLVGSW